MYKVVLYGLIALSFITFILSLLNLLPFTAIQLSVSLALLINTCLISNFVFSKMFKAYANTESWLITSLILFLIIQPPSILFSLNEYLPIFFASLLAIASKYLLAYRKKHAFNPVAISLVILGVLGYGIGTWWIATPYMFIPVVLVGFLIVRKIRKIQMFLAFFIPALLVMIIFGLAQNFQLIDILTQSIFSWPTIFFGTIMLTEPLTTPPRKFEQITYGALVGFIFGTQYNIGPFYSTPELALIFGNIYSYLVSLKMKVFLTFIEKREIAKNTYEFVFKSPVKFPFLAGQYLEWTLPHKKVDLRGVRRYFTISSSPTEEYLRLGVKFNSPSSSFKNALAEMKPGDKILAGNLYGDFVLPEDEDKYVFIAGGIGITPFRSMIKYLIDKNITKDIYLLYSCKFLKEVSYEQIFQDAEKVGIKTFFVITDESESLPRTSQFIQGRITNDLIKEHISDFDNRHYFLSGPNAMVEGYKKLLKRINIPNRKIHTDYFPGF